MSLSRKRIIKNQHNFMLKQAGLIYHSHKTGDEDVQKMLYKNASEFLDKCNINKDSIKFKDNNLDMRTR